mgnify:CR=1 FL=1
MCRPHPRPMPGNAFFRMAQTPQNSITSLKFLSLLYETRYNLRCLSLLGCLGHSKKCISRHRTGMRPAHTFTTRTALLNTRFCKNCIPETRPLGCGGLSIQGCNSASMRPRLLSVRAVDPNEGVLKRYF